MKKHHEISRKIIIYNIYEYIIHNNKIFLDSLSLKYCIEKNVFKKLGSKRLDIRTTIK